MPERIDKWLKICCLVFGGLLLFHVTKFALRQAPLAKMKIPTVPSLPVTNAPTATNAVAATNAAATRGSNSVATTGTNTNSAVVTTNLVSGTNIVATKGTNTNSVAVTTNVVAGTNVAKSGTNVAAASTNSGATNITTNIAAARGASNGVPPSATPNMPAGMPPSVASSRRGGPGGPGALGPDVPPAVRARVEKIVSSEIFGPITRPLPMALLGIAGREAFMRAPTGQTGLMKEGDELGGIKMITIGTNRVLVDEDGQKKELMIFAGIGSETLMPKAKETTNEPIKKLP